MGRKVLGNAGNMQGEFVERRFELKLCEICIFDKIKIEELYCLSHSKSYFLVRLLTMTAQLFCYVSVIDEDSCLVECYETLLFLS